MCYQLPCGGDWIHMKWIVQGWYTARNCVSSRPCACVVRIRYMYYYTHPLQLLKNQQLSSPSFCKAVAHSRLLRSKYSDWSVGKPSSVLCTNYKNTLSIVLTVTIQRTNSSRGMTPLDLLLGRIVHWTDLQNLPQQTIRICQKNYLHWTHPKIFQRKKSKILHLIFFLVGVLLTITIIINIFFINQNMFEMESHNSISF